MDYLFIKMKPDWIIMKSRPGILWFVMFHLNIL